MLAAVSKGKPVHCEQCDRWIRAKSYAAHQRIHDIERPYVCDVLSLQHRVRMLQQEKHQLAHQLEMVTHHHHNNNNNMSGIAASTQTETATLSPPPAAAASADSNNNESDEVQSLQHQVKLLEQKNETLAHQLAQDNNMQPPPPATSTQTQTPLDNTQEQMHLLRQEVQMWQDKLQATENIHQRHVKLLQDKIKLIQSSSSK